MIIDNTSQITKSIVGLSGYDYYTPSTYFPTISKEDYNNGYISRYFVSRINFEESIETNYRDFQLTDTSFFKKMEIKWKITGPKDNIYIGKMLKFTGVKNYNILRINELQQIIPNVNIILNNPLQYWQGF